VKFVAAFVLILCLSGCVFDLSKLHLTGTIGGKAVDLKVEKLVPNP